jgi:DNA sulfur modification protein DndC
MTLNKIKNVEGIIAEIIDQYAYADQSDRPLIIGFSGGKDSTVLLMLVWIALQRIRQDLPYFQLKKERFMWFAMIQWWKTQLFQTILMMFWQELQKVRDQDLPIFVQKTTPKLEETF